MPVQDQNQQNRSWNKLAAFSRAPEGMQYSSSLQDYYFQNDVSLMMTPGEVSLCGIKFASNENGK